MKMKKYDGELISKASLSRCVICPRECGVDRLAGVAGYCGAVGDGVRVSLVSLHKWEEPCLVGADGRGAGTVFFSHCSLRCVFCQNSVISSGGTGIDISVERLAEIFLEQQARGAATLDLVTPTHYTPQIITALREAKTRGLTLPVVWNSSGYERADVIRAIADDVDIFLPDMKYIDGESGAKYSGAADYPSVAMNAVREMVSAKGKAVMGADGQMKSGVIVRHMVLPGRRRESMRIVDWLHEEFADDIIISLMSQYTPMYRAKSDARYHEISRRLTTFEYESVTEHALDIGVTHCYTQERRAASVEYVPSFDGSGVISAE